MRTPRKLKAIQWGEREALLLAALEERAAVEDVLVPTLAEAVRTAMAVAVAASPEAWRRCTQDVPAPRTPVGASTRPKGARPGKPPPGPAVAALPARPVLERITGPR